MFKRNKFPLWKNDGKPAGQFENWNRDSVAKLIDAIKKKELVLIENKCLCHNEHEEDDVVIAEKDRFGLPIPQVLCSKCGLVRSGLVFNEKSNVLFYERYYRAIYSGSDKENIGLYFQAQVYRGEKFIKLLETNDIWGRVFNVAEIGCGSGGVLYPFMKKGKNAIGVDLDKSYLDYGILMGVNLQYGDFNILIHDDSMDVVILSHVLEHFVNPLEELVKIISKISIGGYLLFEVPGLYWKPSNMFFNPILFFQNAHIIQYYYEDYLRILFSRFGLKVIYGDERCTFICQKVSERIPDVTFVYDELLSAYPNKNAEYLIECKRRYDEDTRVPMQKRLFNVACKLGWKHIRPYIKRNKTYSKQK